MALERTFSIIKPDAVKANHVGGVVQTFEEGGLRVIGMKMIHMTREQAEGFYAVHKERPFYKDLVGFMTSGPCVVQVLEGENAVARNREIMGATDSKKADKGTVRQKFGTDIERNAVHGSDSPDNAKIEIAFFFTESELLTTARR